MTRTRTLQLTTPSDRQIAMTRVFDAPRTLVFEALTRPELLKRWFHGPEGWQLVVCENDLRVGGMYRYVWRGTGGTEMGMGGVYSEVIVPERYSASEEFDQAWYPGTAHATTVLTEHAGKTTMTTTVTYSSREVRDLVLKSPMEEGAEGGYDRLAAFLAEQGER